MLVVLRDPTSDMPDVGTRLINELFAITVTEVSLSITVSCRSSKEAYAAINLPT